MPIDSSTGTCVNVSPDIYVSVFFINATSLAKPGAVQLLETEIQGKYGIALIAETWFTGQHLDSVVSIDNYILFRRDRLHRKGGGVCAYIHNGIKCCYYHPTDYNHDIEIL